MRSGKNVVSRHLPERNKLNVMSCRDICLKKYNIRHRYLPTNIKTSTQRATGQGIHVGPSLVTGRVCRLGPLSADSVRTVRVCRFGLDLYSSADSDYELRAVCRLSPNPRGVLGVTKICRFGRSWDGHVVMSNAQKTLFLSKMAELEKPSDGKSAGGLGAERSAFLTKAQV